MSYAPPDRHHQLRGPGLPGPPDRGRTEDASECQRIRAHNWGSSAQREWQRSRSDGIRRFDRDGRKAYSSGRFHQSHQDRRWPLDTNGSHPCRLRLRNSGFTASGRTADRDSTKAHARRVAVHEARFLVSARAPRRISGVPEPIRLHRAVQRMRAAQESAHPARGATASTAPPVAAARNVSPGDRGSRRPGCC